MTDDVVRLWPPKPNATTPIKCLGPMVRANSTALRILALESGADVVYSEELIARRMEVTQFRLNETLGTADWLDANGKSVALRVDPARERGRLVVQFGAADGDVAARAAEAVAPYAAGVDLNMGCPKPFSAGNGMGSALMRDPARAASIVKAMRRAMPADVAVTAKIRLRETEAATMDVCRALQAAGAAAIAVHCRYVGDDPPKDPPQLPSQRSLFSRLRSEHAAFREDCALLANGDLYTPAAVAAACAGEGRADGVLVARPALLDCSAIFRADADRRPRLAVLRDYMRLARRYDAHHKNAKYVVMEMLAKRRHPAAAYGPFNAADPLPGRVTISAVSTAKSLRAIDDILGVDDVVETRPLVDARDAISRDDRAYSDAYFADDDARAASLKRPREGAG